MVTSAVTSFVYIWTICRRQCHHILHSASGRMREPTEGEAPAPASKYLRYDLHACNSAYDSRRTICHYMCVCVRVTVGPHRQQPGGQEQEEELLTGDVLTDVTKDSSL